MLSLISTLLSLPSIYYGVQLQFSLINISLPAHLSFSPSFVSIDFFNVKSPIRSSCHFTFHVRLFLQISDCRVAEQPGYFEKCSITDDPSVNAAGHCTYLE